MGWLQTIFGGLGAIVSPVVGYFKNKQQLAAQAQTNKLKYMQAVGDRQAALAREGLTVDAVWEMQSMQDGAQYRGFELYILSIPMVLCFTPYAYIVRDGFDALSRTPQWFQWLVLTIYLANYGIRLWRRQISPGLAPVKAPKVAP